MGEVIKPGSPTKVTQTAEAGKTTRTYVPSNKVTGHKTYGPEGEGTNKEMIDLLADARAKKQNVTAYSKKGIHYWAGETIVDEKPASLKTQVHIDPKIRKIEFDRKPVYEKSKTKVASLKRRDLTVGGSSRDSGPATKHGTGSFNGKKTKVKIKTIRRGRV